MTEVVTEVVMEAMNMGRDGFRHVFFVSDSTGITVETLGNALLSQFDHVEFEITTIPFVNDAAHADAVVARINETSGNGRERPLVFCTIADSGLRKSIGRSDALVLDIFQAFIGALEQELHVGSSHALGRFHTVTDKSSYEDRIGAVEFALNHDDGVGARSYADADVILIGVSRSGKTPTCVYLAMQFGIKTANFPLTEDFLCRTTLPTYLLDYRTRLFGLTISPDRLQRIRSERRPGTAYASPSRCRTEVREAETLFERHQIPYLDTSAASIEEIASRVLLRTGLRRHAY
ncbi:MAG: kinase/pyrophosphorylase [Thiotrichales bacterium]|nr:kinase/pyrophosphorylase [Thiotrichales bacterium]